MTKREPRWVRVFLAALERTGNVRLAAEQAGIDFTTAHQRRKRHPDLRRGGRALWRHIALGAGPLHHWLIGQWLPLPQRQAEQELSLVLTAGRSSEGSDAPWGKRAEEKFLTELTVSGNVRRAAEAAGFSTAAVYKRRLKDRHFTAAWDAAIETGKARVQGYLVEAATRAFDPDELPIGEA